jgi:hypothetical protein
MRMGCSGGHVRRCSRRCADHRVYGARKSSVAEEIADALEAPAHASVPLTDGLMWFGAPNVEPDNLLPLIGTLVGTLAGAALAPVILTRSAGGISAHRTDSANLPPA